MANEDLQLDEIDFDNTSMQAHRLPSSTLAIEDFSSYLETKYTPNLPYDRPLSAINDLLFQEMGGFSVPSARKLLRPASGDARTARLAQSTAFL